MYRGRGVGGHITHSPRVPEVIYTVHREQSQLRSHFCVAKQQAALGSGPLKRKQKPPLETGALRGFKGARNKRRALWAALARAFPGPSATRDTVNVARGSF